MLVPFNDVWVCDACGSICLRHSGGTETRAGLRVDLDLFLRISDFYPARRSNEVQGGHRLPTEPATRTCIRKGTVDTGVCSKRPAVVLTGGGGGCFVLRAEARMGCLSTTVMATTTCVWWWADTSGCSPTVLEEDWNPQGERSRPKYQDPENWDGRGTSSRGGLVDLDLECDLGPGGGPTKYYVKKLLDRHYSSAAIILSHF